MLFQQNDANPCIHNRFSDNLDLEQHGDDFLVCGLSSDLECLAEEFKKHFLVKKAEIVSLDLNIGKKLMSSSVESVWMTLDRMLSWIKGMLRVCWMQWE